MPIWLRRFTFNKLKEHYEKVNEDNEKIIQQSKSKNNTKIKRPTFTTKASK